MDELNLGSSDKNNFNNSGNSGRNAQVGWVYRVNYSYESKYLIELAGRYDGHYYFAPGKRYSFFPSLSAGWRLSEEKFIKNNFDWINNLKLRFSYGISGNLAGSAFQYLTSYQTRTGYVFGGTSPIQVLGIYESAQANSEITWETSKKGNIGLDAVFLKGKIDLSIDFFNEKRSDMLLSPATVVPSEYGIGLSQVNAGIMKNRGVDFSIGTMQNILKELHLNATFNLTFARNEMVQTFETSATYNNPNRRQTGRPLNTRFGLQALGLYQTSDFDDTGQLISGLPIPTYGPVAPGDIKYSDLAGAPGPDGKPTGPDGKIDIHDYTVIGHPLFPELIFGLDLGLIWKGFSLKTLWQGAGLADLYLFDELAFPFYNGAKISEAQLDYWTEDNPNASFCRLTPTPITNNTQISSFWIKDGTYLRLKTAEFGYTIPVTVLQKTGIKTVRIFLSGQNLLTFNKVKYLDPELTSDRGRYYFQQKVYAFGINVGF